MNVIYENLFTFVSLINSNDRISTNLRQYFDDFILNVTCQKFFIIHSIQILIVQQNSFDWHFVKTIVYFLTIIKIDISLYVQNCVEFVLRETCTFRCFIVFFFQNRLILQKCK